MLRFVTAGESHGQALVAWISGLPSGIPVDLDFVGRELHRRQLGYGRGARQRIEKDQADFLAGVRHVKSRSALPSRSGSKTATGKSGRRPCRSRTARAPTRRSAA